jgi:hypothetical protein
MLSSGSVREKRINASRNAQSIGSGRNAFLGNRCTMRQKGMDVLFCRMEFHCVFNSCFIDFSRSYAISLSINNV